MISEFTVENLRHIRYLHIAPLARVTLIGGKNGVGKTTFLEALWLFTGPNFPALTARVGQFRGFTDPRGALFFANLFPDFEINSTIRLAARERQGFDERQLNITVQKNEEVFDRLNSKEGSNRIQAVGDQQVVFTYSDEESEEHYVSRAWWVQEALTSVGPGRTQFVGEGTHESRAEMPAKPGALIMVSKNREDPASVASRFGELQLAGKEDRALSLLRHVEPNLDRLSTITIENTPIVYAHISGRSPLPASLLGEGFYRMLELAVSMSHMSGGMLLIDEIENGLHHSTLEDVFSTLYVLAEEFDVQVVATTHSLECFRAARFALDKFGDEAFAYHRLDRRGDELSGIYFDSNMIETAIEHGFDVR